MFYTVSEFIQYTEGRGAKYRDTLVATQFGCSNYFDRGVDSVSTLIGRCFTQAQSLLNTPGVSRGAYYRNALAALSVIVQVTCVFSVDSRKRHGQDSRMPFAESSFDVQVSLLSNKG